MTKKELIKILTQAYYEKKDVEITYSTLNSFYVANEDILDYIANETRFLNEDCTSMEKNYKIVMAKAQIWENKPTKVNKENIEICDICNRPFNFNGEQITYRDYGIPYIRCPHCEEWTQLYQQEELKLDENNLCYPQHFACQKDSEYVAHITDQEVQQECRKILARLKKVPTGEYLFWGTGDVFIVGFKLEDEYNIIVAHNYDEISIANEEEEND